MKVVVAGAGLAGLRAAEALRREGFEGRITIVGDEEVPPYDRPPLSKDVLRGTREPESVYLRSADKLAELELDLLTGTPVHDLDVDRKTIGAGDGELAFDRLIVATGATPRTLPSLEGNRDVLTLRTLDDAVAIAARLRPATRVVVVGAGFIGSEVAASARQLGCEVAIVEQDQAPLSRAIGAAMGAELTRLHLANGTAMHLGMTVERFEDGRVDLSDGTRLEADLVVVGVGVRPNTSWLEGSGIEVDNGVVCDAALTAGHEDVYAIGDVANWDNPLFERRMRREERRASHPRAVRRLELLLVRSVRRAYPVRRDRRGGRGGRARRGRRWRAPLRGVPPRRPSRRRFRHRRCEGGHEREVPDRKPRHVGPRASGAHGEVALSRAGPSRPGIA